MHRVGRVISVGVVLAALALVAGCGDGGSGADADAAATGKATTTAPAKPASTCATSTAPTTVVYKTVAGVNPNTGATRWHVTVAAVRQRPRQEEVPSFFLSTRRYAVVSRKRTAEILDVRTGRNQRIIDIPPGTKNAIAAGDRLYIAGGCSASSA